MLGKALLLCFDLDGALVGLYLLGLITYFRSKNPRDRNSFKGCKWPSWINGYCICSARLFGILGMCVFQEDEEVYARGKGSITIE